MQKYKTQHIQVHILPKHPHITKPTHTYTHILQNMLKQPQYKIHTFKGKAIPLQAWTGPKVSRRLRIPDCKTVVVRLSALCTGRFYLQETFLVLISVRGSVEPRAIVHAHIWYIHIHLRLYRYIYLCMCVFLCVCVWLKYSTCWNVELQYSKF